MVAKSVAASTVAPSAVPASLATAAAGNQAYLIESSSPPRDHY